MKTILSLVALMALLAILPGDCLGKGLSQLKVLYIGTERGREYIDFLRNKVAKVASVTRPAFKPVDAEPYDVVLLYWPQGNETRETRKLSSPLGLRESWHKPTVLLGSAGLNLAVAWKLKGGSGCTCLDPMAYDLRPHEIFDKPFAIDRGLMISVPTPEAFEEAIKEKTIRVLPLVTKRSEHDVPGWCSYSTNFASYPEVEFFCGGINHKTPTAAALWRQGNLLHFGFEPSPTRMNETGRRLLLNAIEYISRFSEDQPIAVTPSVFGGPVAYARMTAANWLRDKDYPSDFAKDVVSPEIWAKLLTLPDRGQQADWAKAQAKFLHPNSDCKLEIDADLEAIDSPFDVPAFFEKCLAGLSDAGEPAERAKRLLERYVPCGPKSADAAAWQAWWKENQPYLFASDAGDYRWYIDELAKKRQVPSKDLRGPQRADRATAPLTAGAAK